MAAFASPDIRKAAAAAFPLPVVIHVYSSHTTTREHGYSGHNSAFDHTRSLTRPLSEPMRRHNVTTLIHAYIASLEPYSICTLVGVFWILLLRDVKQ